MKNTTTTAIAVLIFFLTGCKDAFKNVLPKKTATAITVIGDETDYLKKQPSDKDIISLFSIDNNDNIYNGFYMRYRDIADVSNGDVQNLSIEPEYAIFSNANQRIGMLKRFKERIKDVFARAKKNYQGTQNQSVVYVTVVSEANKIMALNLGDDGQRYMVIYSDLLDHDETLDLYNPVILNAVVNHPEQVMKSMESVLKVGNLKGLKILILFQSNDHDIAEDRHFNISSHFYQRLFTAHGAEVVIAGNLQSMN